MPFFSIIIPVYNAKAFLDECLASLFNQSFPDWQALCIDDGSTDGGDALLEEYARKDGRVVVIHQENEGVGAARNKGLELAQGSWILFLDADDTFVPWAFESIANCIASNPCLDFLVFKAQHVSDMSIALPQRPCRPLDLECLAIADADSARVAYSRLYGSLFAWGACHRRDFLKDIRFASYPNGEDVLFGYDCVSHAKRIGFVDSEYYRYRITRAGSASAPSLRNLQSCCDNIAEWHRITSKWQYRDAVHDITKRKWRIRICGVMYQILVRLDRRSRRKGKALLLDFLREQKRQTPYNFTSWSRFWITVASATDSLFPFSVFVYLPFRCQVLLLKLPTIRNASNWLKKARGNAR